MVKTATRQRRRRSQPVSTRSISLLDIWWKRADAAVQRGRARSISHFFETICEQGDNVGLTMLEAVNDVEATPPPPRPPTQPT